MEVFTTTSTDPITSGTQTADNVGSGVLTRDDFMLLLMTQLKNQDPMEPMDSESMLNQFTQLNSLEELQSINQNISELFNNQSLSDAAGLLGQQVTVADTAGYNVHGIVSSISQNADQIELWINGVSYPLSSLRAVEQVED